MRSSHDIGAIDQEVARQGQRITGQDNVVYWGDGGCGGGVAYGSGDTRPGVENSVNNAPGIADDYFHPNPPAGSFLATTWNLASCANRMVHRPDRGAALSTAGVDGTR